MIKEKQKESAEQGASPEVRPTKRSDGREGSLAHRARSAPAMRSDDPFGVMRRFADEMDRIFGDFGFGRGLRSRFIPRGAGLDLGAWSPQIEVLRRGEQLVVQADLPGLKKDDLHVEVRDDMITTRGEPRHEHKERREGCLHSERSYGSFHRSIPLPEGVDAAKAEATFRNGVLEITMPAPKIEESRGRRIEVKG
jgi:HSP20 family protein